MKRSLLFLSLSVALFSLTPGCTPAAPDTRTSPAPAAGRDQAARLTPPASGTIPVAFVVSPGATVIDFAGPWEVFQDVMVPGRGATMDDSHPFHLYTVGPSRDPAQASGGLRIVPDYTFDDAPSPKVIVVPAQSATPAMLQWLRAASGKADLTMSVCTGAFVLAQAGLLDGRSATTHHEYLDRLEIYFPNVHVLRDVRYVEGPRIATAGGLTSGIDLALRVVERYFGHDVAQQTAVFMEHNSTGWHREAGFWDASPGKPAGTP